MATKGRRGVDDEECGRVFIGFDDYTISHEIDGRWNGEKDEGMQRRDAPWNLTNGKMRRDGYNTSWRRESERNMARTRDYS